MSQTVSENDSSDYRISFEDIRGVGPATIDKLNQYGIEQVDGLFLLRKRHNPAHRTLKEKGVGSDTLTHLRAVGEAVHYSGSTRVKAKHCVGSITDDAAFGSSFVDIAKQEETNESEGDETPIPEYDTETLQEALDAIHADYPEGYGNQVSFEADMGRFVLESDTYERGTKLPQGIVQSVIRYRHEANRVEAQGDFTNEHKALLVDFSRSL